MPVQIMEGLMQGLKGFSPEFHARDRRGLIEFAPGFYTWGKRGFPPELHAGS